MLSFIEASQSYDGAFGMAPGTDACHACHEGMSSKESHGGCTYCAVAAMTMLGVQPPRRQQLEHWRLTATCERKDGSRKIIVGGS